MGSVKYIWMLLIIEKIEKPIAIVEDSKNN